jgi:uncharacterized protein (TIGR02271 family)
MITMDKARTLQGKTMYGKDHDKLGTISTLYADRQDGDPTFATVETGLFGTKTSFVPLADATLQGDEVVVPYSKDLVKDAPKMEEDSELEPPEEERLYAHYGLTGTTSNQPHTERSAGHDTSGPNTDDAMTRSEEQVRVGKAETETGRAKLRKYVVTENVQKTVPVSHEEVRVEREPITDQNVGKAMDGPPISEEEHEVVLHAEEPVVQKEAVPVERVRVGKEKVTDSEQVSEQVRKEQIEMEGADVYPQGERAGERQTSDRR